MRAFVLASTVCLAACGLAAAPALAETRALLVGIGDYEDDGAIADLAGPANDVALMRDALSERGITDLRIITDLTAGAAGAIAPTRMNILAALAALAEDSGPGDLAIVHISGHGTQQPDTDGDEPDGYDEVLLPSDTRRAAPGERTIPNAITDDEIGRAIDAIRDRGADVWLIVDACHSGTAVRAAGTAVRARRVDPIALFPHPFASGKPSRPEPGLAGEAVSEPRISEVAASDRGGLMAFYAAQSSELAREIDFAQVAGISSAHDGTKSAESAWYGFFTATLAERLRDADDISYHRLFQAVLADMNAAQLPAGAARQTPYWEGDLRDAPVLGGSGAGSARQYRIASGSLQAGLVQGLQVGTVLALYDDPAAPDAPGAPLAQITELSALSARLEAVGPDCVAAGETLCAAMGQIRSATFARVVSEPAPQTTGLAVPLDLTGDAPSEMDESAIDNDPLLTELRAVLASDEQLGSSFAFAAAAPDLDIGVRNGRLYVGETVWVGGQPAGLSWAPSDGVDLAVLLRRLAAARRWLGVAEAVARERGLRRNPITVETMLVSGDPGGLAPEASLDPTAECDALLAADRYAEPRALQAGEALKQCDMVVPSVSTTGGQAYDVNHIYIDAEGCVWADHLRIPGRADAVPLLPAPLTLCSDCGGERPSAGVETALVLVTEARDNADQVNLVGRIETCGGAPTRGLAEASTIEGPIGDFLDDMLDAAAPTRGRLRRSLPANAWIERIDWTIQPRAAALGTLPIPAETPGGG